MMGIRNVHDAHIGDTFHHTDTAVDPLPGFKPAKPMVSQAQVVMFGPTEITVLSTGLYAEILQGGWGGANLG